MGKDTDKFFDITKRNMTRRSARDIPYVSWSGDKSEPNTQVLGTGRTYKERQNDKIFRKQGLGVFDRGDEEPMDSAKPLLKRSSGKSSPKR